MKKCNATISFDDGYGDNCFSFYCQLEKGHLSRHQEEGVRMYDNSYKLEWEKNERQFQENDLTQNGS